MNLRELEEEIIRLRVELNVLVSSYSAKVDPDILKKIQEAQPK